MNIDIRQAIHVRLQQKSQSELLEVIRDSIHGDERVLPGLGVILELVWNELDSDNQTVIVQKLLEKLTSPVTSVK